MPKISEATVAEHRAARRAALLAAAVAAVPPALYAATRDPVRVLRTP